MQNQRFAALSNVIDKAKTEVHGQKKTILNIIKMSYLSILCVDAIETVTYLLNDFVSKLSGNINTFMKQNEKQTLNESDLTEEDKQSLKLFRKTLADSMSEELVTLLVQSFHQKFSGHLMKLAENKMNEFASSYISKQLNTNRTVEDLM